MSQHLHETTSNPQLPVGRRGFLKFAGFTLAGTAMAGCRRPVEKAIPFLVQPEEVVPGRAVWYASTCGGCNAGCGVLVKNRDGRPIKLEGNPEHPLSQGGLCAVGQASILELYDSQRPAGAEKGSGSFCRNGPEGAAHKMNQTPCFRPSWAEVDAAIIEKLEQVRGQKGAVRLLTGTITSPTTRSTSQQFLQGFADARHDVYDGLSRSAILDAHERTHGRRVLPRYRFERADVIVGLDADFLGTWISPVEYTAGYRARRKLETVHPSRSHHVQIEARLSLTGAKADRRLVVSPAEYESVAASLATALAEKAGAAIPVRVPVEAQVAEIADKLWQARGKSLIVCGVNNLNTQVWVNFCNHLLGNYGKTLDLGQPSYQAAGNDSALNVLLDELRAGKVDALIIRGVNPVYDLPDGDEWAKLIAKVPLVVSVSATNNETSALAHYLCPEPHFLERWDDHEPVAGLASVTQPVIQRLGHTRTFVETLSAWMGRPGSDYELIQDFWKKSMFARQSKHANPQQFWDQTVHDGYAAIDAEPVDVASFQFPALPSEAPAQTLQTPGGLQLVLYPKVTMLDGAHAHNPWLQELPDPISRIAWDNYANLSPTAAARLGVKEADVVRLVVTQADGKERAVELPAHIQPGQHDDVVAVALGYGRSGTERFAEIGPQWLESKPSVGPHGRVGVNAAPLLAEKGSGVFFDNVAEKGSGVFFDNDAGGAAAAAKRLPTPFSVRIEKTGGRHTLAAVQTYDSLTVPEGMAPKGKEKRHEIIEEMAWPDYVEAAAKTPQTRPAPYSLWPEHRYDGHRWGMAIDLDACTGCGACVLACQVENNIPVVGKDEMQRSREMHWLRIDRYYQDKGCQDDFTGENKKESKTKTPDPFSVAFQPMLCQHCENAPCETVCPVLATVHSSEGLNQQVYNRCVGTRYCANNCPYKMRRFNWFDYAHADAVENMILNPDVTVRSRGVMEKCSFCVQRIEAARIEAKGQGRPIRDGEVQPACQQSCPAQAIVFGDMNDPDSAISRLMRSPRYYRALEELNVRPAVGYLMAVKDGPGHSGGVHHG